MAPKVGSKAINNLMKEIQSGQAYLKKNKSILSFLCMIIFSGKDDSNNSGANILLKKMKNGFTNLQ